MDDPAALSPAAAAVLADLEALAAEYPQDSGPELVLRLARRFIRPRLKRRDRKERDREERP
jgi:hypothetical protein